MRMDLSGIFQRWVIGIAVLLVLLNVTHLTWWHYQDQGLPNGDAAHYLWEAEKARANYELGFWDRMWKPTAFPLLLATILDISFGNQKLAVAILGVLSFIIFSLYAFFLLRRVLPIPEALLTASLLGTIPWVLGPGQRAEMTLIWLALSSMGLFHISKKQAQHGIIGAAAFCACILLRPAWSFLYLAYPIWNYRKSIPLSALLISSWVIVIWYLPFLETLFGWIWSCTFGSLASGNGFRQQWGSERYFVELFRQMTGWAIVLFPFSLWYVAKKKQILLGTIVLFAPLGVSFLSKSADFKQLTPWLVVSIAVGCTMVLTSRLRIAGIAGIILLGLSNQIGWVGVNLGWEKLPTQFSSVVHSAQTSPTLAKELFKNIISRPIQSDVGVIQVNSALPTKERFDIFSLNLLARKSNLPNLFDDPWFSPESHHSDKMKKLKESYSHLLIGPIQGFHSSLKDTSQFGKWLIRHWLKAQSLNDIGLYQESEFVLFDKQGQRWSWLWMKVDN